MSWCRNGFTLLEILVVVTLIGVLSGLGAMGFQKVREGARKAECISGLRQLGAATELYKADHGGDYFPYVQYTEEGRTWFFGFEPRNRSAEGDRALDRTLGPLFDYLQEVGEVEICPSFRYDAEHFSPKFAGASFGYGYNWWLGGKWRGQPVVSQFRIEDPARTIVFGDCAQVKPFGGQGIEEFYIIDEREVTVHFRHNKKANFLFADGHIESFSPYPGTIDSRSQEELIGRITPVGSTKYLGHGDD
ncbi:MAG: prepilin-type N-terminal cleavage/methylation domain-containing protein [Verrucomicrobiota bacterium]